MKARLPQGYGGGPGNMQSMLKQAQKMQEDMATLQEDLDAREYDIKAGGGAVTVKINGKLEVLSIDLKPEVVDPDDIETLSDILVAAVGRAKMITADYIKEGAVVIDVGMNRDENGKLCGDVDFAAVEPKCSYITPVPGGVGPMTITMLMQNTVTAAKQRRK
mgnify:CR=1 FL=1